MAFVTGRVAPDAGLKMMTTPETFDPGQDAPNWAALQALQNSPDAAWVYSTAQDIVLWANTKAVSIISASQARRPPPRDEEDTPCATVAKDMLAEKVERLGCCMEYSVAPEKPGASQSQSSVRSNVPGWPTELRPPDAENCRVTLQYAPIQLPEQMQVSQQQTVACLVQMHSEWQHGYSKDEVMRIIEMHNSSRIFRFMFDRHGKLLQANDRALTYLQDVLNGDNMSAWTLFQLGIYKSSKDRQSQYNLAFETVFVNKESFRCQHERVSRKNPGERKWVELEMWPIQDPISGEPAVLVSQMNMTRTKMAEVQLQEEKDELMEHAEALEAKLNDRPVAFTVKSPMQKLVEFFDGLMKGAPVPDMKTLLKFRAMVVSSNLGEVNIQEILEGNAIQSDAGLSILQQLGYRLSGKSQTSQRRSGGPRHSSIEGEEGLPDMGLAVDVTQSHRDFSDRLLVMDGMGAIGSPPGPLTSRSVDKDTRGFRLPPRTTGAFSTPALPEDRTPTTQMALSKSKPEFSNSPLATKNVLPVLERCLQKARDWDFDVFELNSVSHGNPLSSIGFFLLKQSGLVSDLGLDEERLTRWLRAVEETYEDNPYHNRIHAADVTQTMFTMLMRGGLYQGLSKYQLLAAILAAIVHDAGHPGNTNDYLVAIEHPLAIEYNDNSPLENYHACTCFKLMRNDEYNFLPDMELEVYRSIRTLIIDLVLATDMKKHFDTLSQFQCGLTGATAVQPSAANQTGELAAGVRRLWERIPDNQMTEAQHALKLKVALKVADLGHLASPYPIHMQWVERLQEEFFCQGDNEQTFNIPVSPLMDRRKSGIMTAQIGFFDVVAMPLYRSLATAYSKCRPMADGLERNYSVWKAQNGTGAGDGVQSQQRFCKRHNTL